MPGSKRCNYLTPIWGWALCMLSHLIVSATQELAPSLEADTQVTLFALGVSLLQSDKSHMDHVPVPLGEPLLLNGELEQLTRLAHGLRQRMGLHTVTCDATWPAGQDCGSWKRQDQAC